jgi:hypothetical protein
MQAVHWLGMLANEICERLNADAELHGRRASRLVLYVSYAGGHKSKSGPLSDHTTEAIVATATELMRAWAATAPRGWAVTGLGLSASGFDGAACGNADLKAMFSRRAASGAKHGRELPGAQAAAAAEDPVACQDAHATGAPDCSHVLEEPSRCAMSGAAAHCDQSVTCTGDLQPGAVGTVGGQLQEQGHTLHVPLGAVEHSLGHAIAVPGAQQLCAAEVQGCLQTSACVPARQGTSAQMPCMADRIRASAHSHDRSEWEGGPRACMDGVPECHGGGRACVDALVLAQLPSELRSEVYLSQSVDKSLCPKAVTLKKAKTKRVPAGSKASGRQNTPISSFFTSQR